MEHVIGRDQYWPKSVALLERKPKPFAIAQDSVIRCGLSCITPQAFAFLLQTFLRIWYDYLDGVVELGSPSREIGKLLRQFSSAQEPDEEDNTSARVLFPALQRVRCYSLHIL